MTRTRTTALSGLALAAMLVFTLVCKKTPVITPGALKWLFHTDGDIWSSPAVGPDGTIYVGAKENDLYAINPDGTFKWLYEAGGWIASSPTVGSDGTVYAGAEDGYRDT